MVVFGSVAHNADIAFSAVSVVGCPNLAFVGSCPGSTPDGWSQRQVLLPGGSMTEERRCTAAKNRAEFSGALGTWTYGYAQTQMGGRRVRADRTDSDWTTTESA